VAELAQGVRENRPHRASGDVAFHVLEVMHGLLKSAGQRAEVEIQSAPAIPTLMEQQPLPAHPQKEIAHD